jgi:hypothetical protein
MKFLILLFVSFVLSSCDYNSKECEYISTLKGKLENAKYFLVVQGNYKYFIRKSGEINSFGTWCDSQLVVKYDKCFSIDMDTEEYKDCTLSDGQLGRVYFDGRSELRLAYLTQKEFYYFLEMYKNKKVKNL